MGWSHCLGVFNKGTSILAFNFHEKGSIDSMACFRGERTVFNIRLNFYFVDIFSFRGY